MLPFLVSHVSANRIRYNSLVQLKNKLTKTKLGLIYDETDARFKKPVVVSQNDPFDDTWNWALISPRGEKVSDQIKCGDNTYLFNAYREVYLNVRYDNKMEKNIVFASRTPNGNHSAFNIECARNNEKIFTTDKEIFLKNEETQCYINTDFTAHHPEIETAFLVNCSTLSTKSIWSVTEGLFINEPEEEETKEKHADGYASEDL